MQRVTNIAGIQAVQQSYVIFVGKEEEEEFISGTIGP